MPKVKEPPVHASAYFTRQCCFKIDEDHAWNMLYCVSPRRNCGTHRAHSKTISDPSTTGHPVMREKGLRSVAEKNQAIVVTISRHETINKPSDRDPLDDVCWITAKCEKRYALPSRRGAEKILVQRHFRDTQCCVTAVSLNASPACLSANFSGPCGAPKQGIADEELVQHVGPRGELLK